MASVNVSIYLCPSKAEAGSTCKARTTDQQVAAIQNTLQNDPQVKSFKYFSEDDAYNLGKQQDPALAKYLLPGVLPASFSVSLHDLQRDYDSFQAKYSALPGVGQVTNQIDTLKTLLNIIDSVRIFSIGLAILVLIASIGRAHV